MQLKCPFRQKDNQVALLLLIDVADLPLEKSTSLEPLTQVDPLAEDVEKRREQAYTDISVLSKETVTTAKERSNSVKGFNIFLNSSEEVIYNGILKRGRCFSFFKRHVVFSSYCKL